MLDCVIDLSHNNGTVDFYKVKSSGIKAVIIKATQGKAWVDPNFTKNVTNAVTSGLLVGAYHFGTGDDVQNQVNHFLNVAGGIPLKVLDFEVNPSGESMSVTQANDFVQSMASVKLPMIYSDFTHIQQFHIFPTLCETCPLWVAQYKNEDEPSIPINTWANWTLWQHTDSGSVQGVNGKVDRSYFNGEVEDLEKIFL